MARFLEGRGLVSEALYIATDPDYRFELAVQLGELDLALSIASESGTEHKWRQLGELALSAGKLEVPFCPFLNHLVDAVLSVSPCLLYLSGPAELYSSHKYSLHLCELPFKQPPPPSPLLFLLSLPLPLPLCPFPLSLPLPLSLHPSESCTLLHVQYTVRMAAT